VRVRYADTDQMGVVYYANYLVWFEVGRTELLRDRGWSYREMESAGVGLPVIEVACNYHRPSQYDDELEIRTLGSLISPVRLQFTYDIVRCGDGVQIVTGRTLHAAINREGRPCRLPERLRELLT
jgi:acyl-CoA thioester hydrolase